jgi:hypothetical protein
MGGWMDERIEMGGQVSGWMDGWMDGWMEERIRMDIMDQSDTMRKANDILTSLNSSRGLSHTSTPCHSSYFSHPGVMVARPRCFFLHYFLIPLLQRLP